MANPAKITATIADKTVPVTFIPRGPNVEINFGELPVNINVEEPLNVKISTI